MEKEYLTAEQLRGFENYKYACKDLNPLSIYVMHPFWDRVVKLCPKWVAPNVLTFVGFLFTLITFFMLTWLDYDFYASDLEHPEVAPLPRWVFTVTAVNLFLAYTLDGIDGKQARRTGTSGPLGELFDHGLDSYTAGIIPVTMYSIFGRSTAYSLSPYRMYFILWNILINFHLPHWEKYNTGVLFLPLGYDFSMWGTIITFLVTGVWGHEMWQFVVFGSVRAGNIFEIVLYVSAIVSNVPVILWNVYKSYVNKTGHMRPFSEAVRPLVPVSFFFALCVAWTLYSPSNIIERDPRVVYFLTGTIFSNICCRLIVAQMSSVRCEIYNSLLTPAALVVSISLLTKSARVEVFLTYVLTVLATLAHVHYAVCVVRQMCKHFRISCFVIRKRSD